MPILMVGHGKNGHQIQRANTNKLWLIVNVKKYKVEIDWRLLSFASRSTIAVTQLNRQLRSY